MKLKVGLFGIGLDTCWPKFGELLSVYQRKPGIGLSIQLMLSMIRLLKV